MRVSKASAYRGPELRALEGARRALLNTSRRPTLRVLHPSGSIKNIGHLPARWMAETGSAIEFVEPGGLGGLSTIERFNRVFEFARDNPDSWDVYSCVVKGLAELVERGVVQSLDPYVTLFDPGLDEGACRIPGRVREYGRYRGSRYGLILEAPLLSCYFRRDLVEHPDERRAFEARFGYELKPPSTWLELKDQVAFFHRPDEGLFGYTAAWGDWSYFWYLQLMLCYGGAYFDEDMTPALSREESVRALEDLAVLASCSPPEAQDWDWFEWYEAFCGGSAYATIAWPSLARYANTSTSSRVAGKVGYALPSDAVGDRGLAASLYCIGHMWVVSKTTTYSDLGYLWAQWNTSPTVSAAAITGGQGTLNPSRACHLDDSSIVSAYTDDYVGLSRRCFEVCLPELAIPGATDYLRILNRAVGSYLAGSSGKSAEGTLTEVCADWSEITRRFGLPLQRAAYEWLTGCLGGEGAEVGR